jgi:aminomethyltransferase
VWDEPGPTTGNERPWPVRAGRKPVGEVRSAVYSPRLEMNLALAMIGDTHTVLGTSLTIENPAGPSEAWVSEVPFYDPSKSLVR